MINLALIYHMHQPYYKNLLTEETPVPWVRLHGIKDYLDMVEILKDYPEVKQIFNLVPSLVEQVQDYVRGTVKDKFLDISYKPAAELTQEDKDFIRQNFFSINKDRVIAIFPRYYDLYFKKMRNLEFTTQDYLDLQVLFNLSWFDPSFRRDVPALKYIVDKARFFTEEEKKLMLDEQPKILKQVIPAYKKYMESGQVEVTLSPYYHPILPLLFNTSIAREANKRSTLPRQQFKYPEDVRAQIGEAVKFFRGSFGMEPCGMWPSEESVSEHIIPFWMEAGVKWIVADEAILFRSLKKKKRDTRLLYRPHLLKRDEGELAIVFRDRNLSDLIGFEYFKWKAEDAAVNLVWHLENIDKAFKGEEVLVTLALDGENAWEYYPNDGQDFLHAFYRKLSESKTIKTVILKDYLTRHPPKGNIKRLSAGSWIYGEFSKWINNPYKNKAWEWLVEARRAFEESRAKLPDRQRELAFKQICIAEGSDWFWWYGEDPDGSFDALYRMHLRNFYEIIGRPAPEYLHSPLIPD